MIDPDGSYPNIQMILMDPFLIQMILMDPFLIGCFPISCTSYADLALYDLDVVNLQAISPSSVVRVTSCNCAQRSTNWHSSVSVVIRLRPRIHVRFMRALATLWFLRNASLKQLGAMSFGAVPLSQMSVQNFVFEPLPTCISVQHLNSSFSVLLRLNGNPANGLSGAFHLNHAHRRRKALLNAAKFLMPNPPSFF